MSNNKLICKICLNSGKVQKGKVVLKIYKLEISWLENINCCVQITGSHNSMEYNGFKISYNQGPFYGQKIQELKQIIDNKNYKKGIGTVEKIDLLSNYISLLKNKISINKKLSIAMDCLNSCASLAAPQIFKELNINLYNVQYTIIIIYFVFISILWSENLKVHNL